MVVLIDEWLLYRLIVSGSIGTESSDGNDRDSGCTDIVSTMVY